MTTFDISLIAADEMTTAREELGDFIVKAADHTVDEVGFGYVLVPDAPNVYSDLRTAFDRSVATGERLPISSENSDDVIYGSPKVNGALRFWHDVNHVRRGLDFGLVDELELSLWHLEELEKAGHPRESLAYRLLHADLTGQVYVQAFAQRFPSDQERFVTGCVTAGLDHGLLQELRRGSSQ
jgi:hypothetical protein